MKRYLNRNRHQLSDWEKENLWRAIEAGTGGGKARPGRNVQRSFRPALGLAAGVAVLAVAGAWWIGTTDPNRGFGSGSPGVVVLPPEYKVESDQARDPALIPAPEAETMVSVAMELLEEEDAAPAAPVEKMAAREVIASATRTAPAAARLAAPAGGTVRGRVLDKKTGKGLDYASVLIRGTNRCTMTAGGGTFIFTGLASGRKMELQILMVNYTPAQITVTVPDTGSVDLVVNLEPAIVETLGSLDFEGQKPMGGAKSFVAEDCLSEKSLGTPYRGGRKGDVAMSLDSRMAAPGWSGEPPAGSVTGGTRPPNGEEVELMYFEHTGVNPFVATEDDSLSTFAVDVDNASWTLARNYLRKGMLPPKDAIRVEEFVNAFDAGWPTQTQDPFRIHTDGSASRFGQGYHLLRVGLVGKTVAADQRLAANLVFVIDISGSMNRENRLGLVKRALHILLDELQEGDRVGIVVYGSNGRILLEPTDIERRGTIEQAIDALGPGGSTNAFEGLELAYAMARRTYEAGKINRLILCSDGVANNGASTEAEQMLEMIRRSSDEGITLSTIGFGMGNYNDVLMEKLADKGDGNYYYVDELKEAERVFRENLTGLLQTIAREVKVQVEFDPQNVTRWRLLGYENRDVADRDFRNDAVDAGEVGSGHQVTALYEIKLGEQPAQVANLALDIDDAGKRPSVRLGTVRLRHQAPAHDTAGAGQVREIEEPILLSGLNGDFATGSVWLRTQAVVAEFAEILRGSYWAKESRLADLIPIADGLAAELPGDRQVKELAELIRLAVDIEAGIEEEEDAQPVPLEKKTR